MALLPNLGVDPRQQAPVVIDQAVVRAELPVPASFCRHVKKGLTLNQL